MIPQNNSNEREINNYINMYNNNIVQINNLYYNNAIIQNNIYLIQNNINSYTNPYRVRRNRRQQRRQTSINMPQNQQLNQPINVSSIPTTTTTTTQPTPLQPTSPLHTTPPLQPTPITPASSNIVSFPTTPIGNIRRRTRTPSFFDPVLIYPTQRQIENATRLIQYDTIGNPTNESCPFTCEPFNNTDMVRQIIHCGHNCSPRQFNTWFYSNVSCPICRYDIRTYEPQPQTIINNEELVSNVAPIEPDSTQSTTETSQLVYNYFDLLLEALMNETESQSTSSSRPRTRIEYIIRDV